MYVVEIRNWDKSFQKWITDEGPRPGKHPEKDHLWNTDPDKFMEER